MRTRYKTTNELPFSLCAEDVAGALGISRAGAYTLIKSKGFPRLKIGGRYIIPKDKFLEWINQNSTGDSEKWIM
jgi:excisionase family DNA binding protein